MCTWDSHKGLRLNDGMTGMCTPHWAVKETRCRSWGGRSRKEKGMHDWCNRAAEQIEVSDDWIPQLSFWFRCFYWLKKKSFVNESFLCKRGNMHLFFKQSRRSKTYSPGSLWLDSFWIKITNMPKWRNVEWMSSEHFLQCPPHGSFPIAPCDDPTNTHWNIQVLPGCQRKHGPGDVATAFSSLQNTPDLCNSESHSLKSVKELRCSPMDVQRLCYRPPLAEKLHDCVMVLCWRKTLLGWFLLVFLWWFWHGLSKTHPPALKVLGGWALTLIPLIGFTTTPATIAAGLLLQTCCARHCSQQHLEHEAVNTPSLTQRTSCCHPWSLLSPMLHAAPQACTQLSLSLPSSPTLCPSAQRSGFLRSELWKLERQGRRRADESNFK